MLAGSGLSRLALPPHLGRGDSSGVMAVPKLAKETDHELGRPRRYDDLQGGRQPRGAVLDLARSSREPAGLDRCRQERQQGRVPGLHQGSLDGHAAAVAAQEDGRDGARAPDRAGNELALPSAQAALPHPWVPARTVKSSILPVERWLAYREVNPRARLRLFCFPYAGGGASAYRGWAPALPFDVEVCPVQLPGRESRLREPAFNRPEPLIAALAEALQAHLD